MRSTLGRKLFKAIFLPRFLSPILIHVGILLSILHHLSGVNGLMLRPISSSTQAFGWAIVKSPSWLRSGAIR